MSKSTLSIIVPGPGPIPTRTVKVPCRPPESFTVHFTAGGQQYGATAYVTDGRVVDIETNEDHREAACDAVDAVWQTIRSALGISGPVPPGSPLPAIALAYEAECAAYDACVKAHSALPRVLHSPALLTPSHPDDAAGYANVSRASKMLAKYVEYVVEQACKAQTERAESKVTPC